MTATEATLMELRDRVANVLPDEHARRALQATAIHAGDRYACLFKSLRNIELATLAAWSFDRASAAIPEALALLRLAAWSAIARPDDLAWLVQLVYRLPSALSLTEAPEYRRRDAERGRPTEVDPDVG